MFNEMMRAEIWLQDTLQGQSTIEDLAQHLGYSASQTRRRFRQCFGISPSAYRDRLRLEKATRLLVHTPLGIKEIAAQCGYRNHSSFSRAFQRNFMLTPRAYRQNHQLEIRRSAACIEKKLQLEIRHIPMATVLVARRYEEINNLPPPEDWKQLTEGQLLANRLNGSIPMVLLSETVFSREMPRTDVGVMISGMDPRALALPPALRLVDLPSQRCACVKIESLAELSPTIGKVFGEALPAKSEFYNGEPLRILQQATGLELQFPLLAQHG
ncbi:helix-turn-helix transcriptional regulator [Halomonas urumqiensis]|uniref:AraC family transcriptional regulator n=1 Tax=Halomonas urumqiensis TaxID=1684789 RepID=A0A2N7UPW6_9GAMM|nr:helix-turn-helix transcriptional regulator [Halomonas urumqiensis]PMR82475.1 AraC family transcriptional regulator [Halomonas urumqiensis]PTB04044.1 AraC family transcriptional regulator [Halomonas urumqiensis]GHE19696.1 hypothetical protein GCM10017767_02170 [Halomonas urumqiensis]